VDWSFQFGDMVKYIFSAFWLSLAWNAARFVLGEGPLWLRTLALMCTAAFIVNAHCETHKHEVRK
jgi:hypothetical protein